MKRYSFALAALALLVTPFAASAYSYMPQYQPTYSGSLGGGMYGLQRSAQALSLQSQLYYMGTDCTDYGYGDCAARLARSGSPYGPGWMIMNPQQSYGGGYSGYGQYQPSYYGGYGYGNSYGNNSYYGSSYPNYYGGGYGNNYGGYNPYGSYNPYGGYYGY